MPILLNYKGSRMFLGRRSTNIIREAVSKGVRCHVKGSHRPDPEGEPFTYEYSPEFPDSLLVNNTTCEFADLRD